MTIWIDAQLSPSLAAWINRNFSSCKACSVRALHLQDAFDNVIFNEARQAHAVIMTKDSDFLKLIDQFGALPGLSGLLVAIHRIKE